MRFLSFTFATLASLALALSARSADDWPQWRGPDGQGHAQTTGLPIQWSESSNVAWKVEVPGRGWSSPVIQDSQIWLTTAIETPARPEDMARRLRENTGDQPLNILEQVDLRAVCFDRLTGKLLHNVSLIQQRDPQWVHELNSYASPSPFLDEGRLYCHFGTLGTACLDTSSAKLQWVNTELHAMHENGPGSSPVVWGDRVMFHLDGSDRQYVAGLDKKTGKTVWQTDRSGAMNANPQLKKSYGTPLIINIDGQAQLLSPGSDWVYGYDPQTGDELWKIPYGQLGFSLTPRPVTGHGMFFMATGFGQGQMLAVRYEKAKTPEIVWRFNRGSPTMPSPLLVGDELYFVSDNGIFTCLDAHTGEQHYRDRLAGNFSSSPIVCDGRIYVANREGTTYVVAASKKFSLLAENKLPGRILATPAAVDGSLYLRTDTSLYCLQNRTATQ